MTSHLTWTNRRHAARAAAGACLLLCLAPAVARAQLEFEREPISYSTSPLSDPVSLLQQRLDAGEATLEHDPAHGYLPAVLKALGISTNSQTLVFSKTSFQRNRISPQTPRALYFNDDNYIGWVQHGEVMEVTSMDPQQGPIFFTLSQQTDGPPQFVRQTDSCLQCHASSMTLGVPGHLVRSVYVDLGGFPVLSTGTYRTTYQSPLKERWGGWYVSGSHGEQRHLGNILTRNPRNPRQVDTEAGANVTDLGKLFKVKPYLTPHSDIVALMVLEHQAPTQNLLTLANYEGRLTLRDEQIMNQLRSEQGEAIPPRTESIERRLKSSADKLVHHLLLAEEAPLTAPIRGTSGFAEEFVSHGPGDRQGRSLRDLDLTRRLFKYPCSYLVYSAAFDGLPAPVKEHVYRRLWEVLSGQDTTKDYAHLSAADRQAILEILRETKPDLPDYWRG